MDYIDILKNGLGVLFFKEDSVKNLAEEPEATKYGLASLVITGLIISVIGLIILIVNYNSLNLESFETGSFILIILPAFFIWCVIFPLVLLIPISVFHLLAKYLGRGHASLAQYFRVAANACIIPVALMFLDLTMLNPDCFNSNTCPPNLSLLTDLKEGIILLWLMLVNIFIFKKLYGLSYLKAVILGSIPFLFLLLLLADKIQHLG